jgi:hypothetical protein
LIQEYLKEIPAEQLTTFVHNEIEYSTEHFFKFVTQIDFDKDRWF